MTRKSIYFSGPFDVTMSIMNIFGFQNLSQSIQQNNRKKE